MITYKGHYSLTSDTWEMSFDKSTPLGCICYLEDDEHELYFVMPGETLAPWMLPLVPTIESDKQIARFLRQTGLENFYWVPTGKKWQQVCGFACDEAAMRFT